MCSPLGLVPKKQGKFRLIHDLSFPHGRSVNDSISHADSTISYANIDDAVRHIVTVGPSAYLAKTDIESAFRLIPVQPQDYHRLGLSWQNNYYYDRCLPMGCASSCNIFSQFSHALAWAAQNRLHIPHVIYVLDDFLFVNSSFQSCKTNLQHFIAMCADIGVPIAMDKTFYPSQVLSFLGIEIDVINSQLRLPLDKLYKCRQLVQQALNRSKLTLRELQSLIGSLNFACRVVAPGRPFLRRLINLTIGVSNPYHRIRLNQSAKADLQAWLGFLQSFNGVSFFLKDPWVSNQVLHLFSDASKQGFGAVFGSLWLQGLFPSDWQSLDIWILELYALTAAFITWQTHFRNSKVLFHCDNHNIVHVLNNCSSPNKSVMCMVRRLVVIAMRINCCFRCVHVPGAHNHLADLLSRSQVSKFLEAHPAPHPSPTPVPPWFLPGTFNLD